MARQRRKGRSCKFESLETRTLLAGDVTARIHHGDLIIKGDGLSNGITITAGPVAGTVIITGVNAGGSATNIADTTNGSAAGTPNGTITLSGFTRNLKIDMKGGDDIVVINDSGARLTVPGKAEILGGKGNDKFTIDGASVNRSLKIELGKGDDILSITDMAVNGKTKLKGNGGNDDVTIVGSTFSKLKTPLGSGDDSLEISGTAVSVKTRLYGEKGVDTYTAGEGNSFTNFKKKGFVESESATSPASSETATPLTLAISGAASVNEGSPYTLSLNSSGSGASSISQWAITWGDGSTAQVVNGNPSSVTHIYTDGTATRTISATATNPSGTTNAGNTVTIAVGNVAPTLSISGAASVVEGSLYVLSLTAADPGADTISQWSIDWGDGSLIQTVTGNPSTVSHTFADGPATRTISAKATDEDGTFNAGNTVTVNVSNAPPAASISGASSVLEGSLYTLNLSSSDAGADTIGSWSINWGDGTAPQTVTGNPSSITHTFADGPGTRTIVVTATDEDGTVNATNSVSVNVLNVAPTLLIIGATSVQEGALYTLNLSSTDLGTDTISQWTINWGDNTPSQVVNGNPATVTHTFADGAQLCTIIATATDEDGTFAVTNSLAVIIDNASPALAVSGASSVDEASLYTLHLSSSDPGADTISQWHINWGDGTPIQIVVGNPTSVTHIFADGAETRTISATATDEDGTYDAGNTVTVAVANVDPTLSINGAPVVNEGSAYSLNLTSSDPGADTIDHWTINWGDSTPSEVVSGNLATASHAFADGPNTFTISATATDEDGTYTVGNTVTVSIQNVPPSVGLSGPSVVSEGTSNSWTLGPFLFDPGQDEISQVIVHWGDGNTESLPLGQALGLNGLSHTYSQGPNAYTIDIDLVDEDGTYVSAVSGDVTVNNVAPTVSVNYSPYADNENTPLTISGNYFDPDLTDAQSVVVEWDDPNNGAASTFALPATSAITAGDTFHSSTDGATLTVNWVVNGTVGFSVAHTYLDDGPAPGDGNTGYASLVAVTVTDDDGTAGDSSAYRYVYDTPATLEWDPIGEISEYATTTFSGAYTDPGLLDAQTLLINWGDPNNSASSTFLLPAIQDASGAPMLTAGQIISSVDNNAQLTITSIDNVAGRVGFSVQHQYVDDGPAPGDGYSGYGTSISSTITGDDSSQTSTYRYATISNVAPTISVDTPADTLEGTPVTITGTFTDPGLVDGHTLAVSWNYGGYSYSPFTSSFALPAMRNLAGTATLNAGDTFTSGDGATLTIVSTDPATGQVRFSIEQYLNDGSAYGNSGVNYPTYITVTVQDDDGAQIYASTSITVANEAPTLSVDPVVAALENSPATISGTITDPGRYDSHFVRIYWGDSPATYPSDFTVSPMLDNNGALGLHPGNTFSSFYDSALLTITSVDFATGTVGFSVQHRYLDDGPRPGNGTPSDTNVISVYVSDDNYVSDSTTRLITINNVTPTVMLDPVAAISENGIADVWGTFLDPGLFDAHALTVNWGDPNSAADSTFDFPAINSYFYPYLISGTSLYSTTDSAVLTITSVDSTTGQVGFHVQHQYSSSAPGNGLGGLTTISATVADDDGQSGTSLRFVTISPS